MGVLAALQHTGGVWFGWSGETSETPSEEPEVVSRGNIRFATIDLKPARIRRLLQRLLQRDTLAPVPLFPRSVYPRTPASTRRTSRSTRNLPAGSSRSSSPGMPSGSRLPVDSSWPPSASVGFCRPDRLLPAHPVSASADPAPAAEVFGAGERYVPVRSRRISDGGRRALVRHVPRPATSGTSVEPACAHRGTHRWARRISHRDRRRQCDE